MIARRFIKDTSGSMAVMFAMAFIVSTIVAAIAVDAGSLYTERRSVQNGTDLAALTAAADPSRATTLAQSSLVEAGLLAAGSTQGLKVDTGHYDPDPNITPDKRFVVGKTPINAVLVSFSRPGTLYFAKGWSDTPMIGAEALATVTPQVSFSIGSRLASLNEGIANGVLNTLLGTKVSLTAMDYNGLLNARVDTFRYLNALAKELNLSVGTYNDMLKLSANHGQLAKALAAVLSGADKAAASKLAATAGNNGVVPLGKLFQLGRLGDLNVGGTEAEGLLANISALDLLRTSAGLSDGTHQVALGLSANVPGLLGLEASIAVGEAPQGGSWYSTGPTGTVVRTAQTRLRILASILGSGALLGIPVRLPLYGELAHSEAVVDSATCPTASNPSGSAVIMTRPGLFRLMIGEVDPAKFGAFNTTPKVEMAKLAEVKLLTITVLQVWASSLVEIAQNTPIALNFSSSEISARTIKTAKTTTIVSSLTSSLLGNMKLQVPILGLGLNLTSLGVLLTTILSPLTPVLDTTIAGLLGTLGLGVGEVDVRVYGVRCSQPVLVG